MDRDFDFVTDQAVCADGSEIPFSVFMLLFRSDYLLLNGCDFELDSLLFGGYLFTCCLCSFRSQVAKHRGVCLLPGYRIVRSPIARRIGICWSEVRILETRLYHL